MTAWQDASTPSAAGRNTIAAAWARVAAQKRFSHGSLLADKQGIQWMMAESALELYASKLMVLHAAYKIENGMDFSAEVSMAKHHVPNTLWRDR